MVVENKELAKLLVGKEQPIDWWVIANICGEELDDMIMRQDYICGKCNLSNGVHYSACIVGKLISMRKVMVPMVIGEIV